MRSTHLLALIGSATLHGALFLSLSGVTAHAHPAIPEPNKVAPPAVEQIQPPPPAPPAPPAPKPLAHQTARKRTRPKPEAAPPPAEARAELSAVRPVFTMNLSTEVEASGDASR
jgi:hypothetical protein